MNTCRILRWKLPEKIMKRWIGQVNNWRLIKGEFQILILFYNEPWDNSNGVERIPTSVCRTSTVLAYHGKFREIFFVLNIINKPLKRFTRKTDWIFIFLIRLFFFGIFVFISSFSLKNIRFLCLKLERVQKIQMWALFY